MKNPGSLCLPVLCFAFLCFAAGIFIGRNVNHADIQLTQAKVSTLSDPASSVSSATVPVLIDINTADVQQLQQLPGIGEALARRIVEYRRENGPFESVGSLMNVAGIGASKLEAIMDYITTEEDAS